MKVGDVIKCENADNAIKVMHDLAIDGVETDFLYEKDNVKGLWLQVKKISE